jgi:hypothetical protein
VTVTALRDAVVTHEQVALQLMSHDAVDRVAFVRQQNDIAARDRTRAQLDGLEAPVLRAMDRGQDRGTTLERGLVAGLAAMFGLALTVTVYSAGGWRTT